MTIQEQDNNRILLDSFMDALNEHIERKIEREKAYHEFSHFWEIDTTETGDELYKALTELLNGWTK